MTTWLITRHQGAKDWLAEQGFVGVQVDHIDINLIKKDDVIIGTLPINLVAKACEIGAKYLHLSLAVPANYRGKELTSKQMQNFGISLTPFKVTKPKA